MDTDCFFLELVPKEVLLQNILPLLTVSEVAAVRLVSRRLNKLVLENSRRISATCDGAADSLRQILRREGTARTLTTISTASTGVDFDGWMSAFRDIHTLTSLSTLRLNMGIRGGHRGCSNSSYLGNLSQLTELQLQNCGFNHTDVVPLSEALSCLTALAHLNLSENALFTTRGERMGMDSMEAFAGAVRGMPQLKHLNLHNTDPSESKFDADMRLGILCETLAQLQHLSFLEVGICGFNGLLEDLAQHVSSMTALEHLGLNCSCPSDDVMAVLTPELQKLPSLRHINLGNSRMTHLPPLRTLTSLHMCANWLTLDQWADGLKQYPALMEADIRGHDEVDDEGTAAAARRGFSGLTTLTALCMSLHMILPLN